MTRPLKKFLCAAIFLGGLSAGPRAWADPPLTRPVVEAMLGGFEEGVRPEVVRSWGATGVQHLTAIGEDPGALVFVRVRAVYALRVTAGTAAGSSTRAWLRALAGSEGAELLVRRAAMDALSEGFGAVAEVAGFLQHPDPALREGAGWALSRCRDEAGRAAVRARLGRETDPGVRQSLIDALATPGAGAGTTPTVPPTGPSRAGLSRGG